MGKQTTTEPKQSPTTPGAPLDVDAIKSAVAAHLGPRIEIAKARYGANLEHDPHRGAELLDGIGTGPGADSPGKAAQQATRYFLRPCRICNGKGVVASDEHAGYGSVQIWKRCEEGCGGTGRTPSSHGAALLDVLQALLFDRPLLTDAEIADHNADAAKRKIEMKATWEENNRRQREAHDLEEAGKAAAAAALRGEAPPPEARSILERLFGGKPAAK